MGVLSDRVIAKRITEGMIRDAAEKSLPGEVSYGITSYGYDARIDEDIYLIANHKGVLPSEIDPKAFNASFMHPLPVWQEESHRYVLLPPHGFALARTVETFNIPRDVLVVCVGKSTYARCGLIVNVTPLEPEWSGTVTLELSNTTDMPVRVYVREGICQMVFHKTADIETCAQSYIERSGKYQGQVEVTPARV